MRALAGQLLDLGQGLHVIGHIIGSARVDGTSPRGNGDDRQVAVGMLATLAGTLLRDTLSLVELESFYSASALGRQLMEVEYLLWAFETDHDDAGIWLNSTHEQRRKFWQPKQLRMRSGGRFRDKDYSQHCELGGHPTPDALAQILNTTNPAIGELVLLDCLRHATRAWQSAAAFAVPQDRSPA